MSLSRRQKTWLAMMLLAAASYYLLATSSKPESISTLADDNNAVDGKAVRSTMATERTPVVESAEPSIVPRDVMATTPSQHDQRALSDVLEGTDIDGALKADVDGNLILDIGVRDFFDYFLSIADDVGAEQAIAEIQRYALIYLPDPAQTQALELLGNYLRYKQSEFQIQQTPITQSSLNDGDALELLSNSFDELKLKRQSLFTKAQDNALFALEDSYANHTLASLTLMADEETSDEQKRAQLAELETQLPAELSASFNETKLDRQRQNAIESVTRSGDDDVLIVERLKDAGLDTQQIDAIISRRDQQTHFDLAYQQYYKAKQSLSPTDEGYSERLTELQKRFFAYPEDLTQAKLRDLSSNLTQ